MKSKLAGRAHSRGQRGRGQKMVYLQNAITFSDPTISGSNTVRVHLQGEDTAFSGEVERPEFKSVLRVTHNTWY